VEALATAKKEATIKAEDDAKKPTETDTKKAEPAVTPAKLPADAKKPENVKAKAATQDKPSDPPKDLSGEPAKAKSKSKETVESGREESGDADEKKTDGADAKPQAAAEKKEKVAEQSKAATDALVVVDFSSLAEGRPANGPFAASLNPLSWKRTEQLAFLLTWSLFGIGLCLMLGLFTRPAALAGAGFMLFVVLSQPSFPGVYPLDPPQLGHALLANKDFVEMVALLVIASTCLGRWTGLDFFIHEYLIKPFCCKCNCKCGKDSTTEGRKA
jgi:uncharacterized membrane protein YphA (DoxX/SURF4 family)